MKHLAYYITGKKAEQKFGAHTFFTSQPTETELQSFLRCVWCNFQTSGSVFTAPRFFHNAIVFFVSHRKCCNTPKGSTLFVFQKQLQLFSWMRISGCSVITKKKNLKYLALANRQTGREEEKRKRLSLFQRPSNF